jgi:hypothetical protein
MSKTKRYYAEQLRDLMYPDVTHDAKFDLQVASAAVGQATAEYIRIAILQNKVETRIIPSNWIAEYNDVKVEFDSKRKRYYAKLPVGVITLPDDQGVYLVHYEGEPDKAFTPVTVGFLAATRHSDMEYLQGGLGHFLMEDKLVFIQTMKTDCNLTMYLVPNHSELGDFDYYPIDDSCVIPILSRAVEIYQIQKGIPEDKLNDGISQ